MGETSGKSEAAKITKQQVKAYLADIEKKVIDREGADMASLVAINDLLNLPNAQDLLDDQLRTQLKDLWIKLKAGGIQVDDPPLLFGLPEGFGEEEVEEEEELNVPISAVPSEEEKPSEPEGTPEPEEVEEEVESEDEPLPH